MSTLNQTDESVVDVNKSDDSRDPPSYSDEVKMEAKTFKIKM